MFVSYSNTIPTDIEAIQGGRSSHGKHAEAAVRTSAIRHSSASQRTARCCCYSTQAEA